MRISLLVLALSIVAAAAANSPLPIISGTVALYQFEEGGGTTAADASGNGHVATFSGFSLPTWVDGYAGKALNFPPGITALTVQTEIPVGATWTIQAWVQFPLSPSIMGAGWTDFRDFTTSNMANGYTTHISTVDGELGLWTAQEFISSGFNVNGLPPGWHLLSAVGSGGSTTYYIDADEVGIAAGQVTDPILYIGGTPDSVYSWGATVDSFRVLSVARSAAGIGADAGGAPSASPTPSASPGPSTSPAPGEADGGPDAKGGCLASAGSLGDVFWIGGIACLLMAVASFGLTRPSADVRKSED